MTTKITLTVTPNTDILDPERIDAAMLRTIETLQRLSLVPLRKLTLAIECKDEDTEYMEDTIDAALSARPVGIEVTLKTTRERHVTRDTLAPVTPMDEAGWDGVTRDVMLGHSRLEPPISEVTLSSGGQSVTLTEQTARNAARMARHAVVSSDRAPR